MAVFTVHTPRAIGAEAAAPEKIVFLKDGFSMPAFVFGPFWLAWKRAWLAALLWTTILVIVGVAGVKFGAPRNAMSIVGVALAALLGFEGSRLVAWTLARRGFAESAVVLGDDADEAEEVFFHDWRAQAPASAEAPPPVTGGVAGERRD